MGRGGNQREAEAETYCSREHPGAGAGGGGGLGVAKCPAISAKGKALMHSKEGLLLNTKTKTQSTLFNMAEPHSPAGKKQAPSHTL